MAITSVPSVSNTQFNQSSTAQSAGGFQDVYVSSENSASEYVSAPIWAGHVEDVVSDLTSPADPFRPTEKPGQLEPCDPDN